MRFCRTAFVISSIVAAAALSMQAETVDANTAGRAAEGFLLRSSAAQRILHGRTVSSLAARGNLWIVSLAPSGHIVFAGSDKCSPVVSFSTDDFAEPEAGSAIYAQLQNASDWVAGKEADASSAVDSGWAKYTATDTKKRLLSAAPSGATVGDGYDDFVNPFLGTTWSQGAPMTDLTPLTSPCGCAATAGGQEFRHWRWPYRFEKSRSFTHALRDSYNNALNYTMRPDGRVPIDWNKVAASGTTSTPWETDKEVGYNTAFLTMWMQTMVNMGFKAGGSYATRKLCSDAENYWYEAGKVMSQGRDGYDNLWCAITNDLKFGSPIQINTPVHQMVIDGYAIENAGTDSEIDYVNTNYGWGNGIRWENLKTAIESGGGAGKFADFQVGFRPQKIVQFEPLAKVSTGEVTLKWHIAPCYTNRTTGFTLDISGGTGAGASVNIATHDETTSYTVKGLETGYEYTFTVTPVMADGSAARANSVATTIGTPQPAPEIAGVSSIACGIDLVQQGFYIECARAITNYIAVTCNESTTALEAYSSHLTILPDEKISVSKNGSVFTIAVDATEMDAKWQGEMLLLTLVAKNADGTETYKNLMLRFNGMRQVLGGTFEMVETNPATPVWFCGTVVLDAKGRDITFGENAFQGNGCDVTLTDSVGGGSFTFASLDGFLGTVAFDGGLDVVLPGDLSAFCGTINVTSGSYTLSGDLPAAATLHLGNGSNYDTQIVLDNATIDGKVTGYGNIVVSSGTSKIAGYVSAGVFAVISGGTLTVPASLAARCAPDGSGTVKITLEDDEAAYGFTANMLAYSSGTVQFVNTKGEVLTEFTTGATPPFVHPDSANTWSIASSTASGSYADTASWSKNRTPVDGEYVRVVNANNQSLYLNSPQSVTLEEMRVTGDGTTMMFSDHPNATYFGATYYTVKANKFRNDTPVNISSTLFQPYVLEPHAALYLAANGRLTGSIDSAYVSYMRASDMQNSSCWQGMVVVTNLPASKNSAEWFNPGNCGNANSKVQFRGAKGYLAVNSTFNVNVELVDDGDKPALEWSNGSSTSTDTFAKLSGSGTFKTSAPLLVEKILLKDISDFTGSFDLAAKTVAIASAMPDANIANNGRLFVLDAATVASGATWKATGGLYVGGGCDLTIAGTLSADLTAYEDGAKVTLAEGGVFIESAAMSGDYAPTLDFGAGTVQFDGTITESKTVNFCASAGKYTTLETCGNTVTLGANYFSGSGDVLFASTCGQVGTVRIAGVGSDYAGTLILDGSTSVVFTEDDLSNAPCTIFLENTTFSAASAKLGNIIVGTGATLTVSLTDSEAMKGFSASSVTLDGGTIEFVDQYGTTVGSSTESTTYVKPDGYTLAPVPTAVWVSGEFEDEATLHGGYMISTTLAGNVSSSGNIVIGSDSSIGATLNLSTVTNTTKASVLVKFKTATSGAPAANAAIMGVISTDGNPISPICTTAGDASFTGAYLNKNSSYALVSSGFPFTTTPTLPESGEGYMLFCYHSESANPMHDGTAFYIGETIEDLAGGNVNNLQWKGHKLTSFYIGGPGSTTIPTWAGLEIEAVALFVDEWFSPSALELYEFPEASFAGRTVYYKSGYWGTGGDTSLVVTLADGTETTLREGDTIVIDDKSSGGIYFGPLPDYANKIRVSRDVVFSSGVDDAAILDGATIEIDDGKTVTFKAQYHNIALGKAAITGEGSIAFDANGFSISLDPEATVNDVAVRPELDLSIATPYDATKEKVFIKAIPGLWYSVIYGDRLVSGGIGGETGETEPVKAPSTGPLTLDAPKEGATRFYRIKVVPVKPN